MEELQDDDNPQNPSVRGRHIKKRSLKNKALSVSFSEKDLNDYVTGFHKRKKKRRKEANQKLAEADRRKRIEARKKRKLEREFAIYGGAQPDSAAVPAAEGSEEGHVDEEEAEPVPSVSGTTTYDNGELKVMVTTSEIAREEEDHNDGPRPEGPVLSVESGKQKQKIPAIKKIQSKKVMKRRSGPKPQKKRDKKKGKGKGKSKRH